jgi:hypothetical protein
MGYTLKQNTNSKIRRGNKNPMWKGNKVTKTPLHLWVKSRLSKPKLCQDCKQKPPYDLANKSGKYKRLLTDWEWLCRGCHMKKDGRLKKLHGRVYKIKPPVICIVCKKLKKHRGLGACKRCYEAVRYYRSRRTFQTVGKFKTVSLATAIKILQK